MFVVTANVAVDSHVQGKRFSGDGSVRGVGRAPSKVPMRVGSDRAMVCLRRAIECICNCLKGRESAKWLYTLGEIE